MGDRRTELEFDEFEKLLGEIPNATSRNPHSTEAGPKTVSLNSGLASGCVNSCDVRPAQKLQSSRSLDDGEMLANKAQRSSTKRVQTEEANLPDDQSLTSAFAELSFTGGEHLESRKTSPNHALLLDCEYTNVMNTSLPSSNSLPMVAPSFKSGSCGFDDFDRPKVGHESLSFLKLEAQELSPGHYQPQPIENFSNVLAIPRGVQGFQLLHNVAFPSMEFPLMSEQQQYFADMQPALPYINSQQLASPHISWRNVEEDQYYRMHQQYLYMQQLRNQRLEAQNPVQANGNVTTKLMSRNVKPPCYEMPMAHQLQQSDQEPFWNNYTVTRGLNQSENTAHVMNKVGKQIFPEKILTRSQGLNTLKSVKFDSVGRNETFAHLNQNGKALPNCHFRHGLSAHGGCFPSDCLSSWNLSPNLLDPKISNLRPQPLKYNSVDEVTGRIYFMAKDQHGCRFLQRKFSEGTMRDVEKIFLEIIDHIVELMTHPFGNYLVQKLLEVCTEDQQMQILRSITRKSGELVRISCDMHGTRAVQKVIETLKTTEQISMIVSSLKPGIVSLIKNMNGNHVAQRCLQYLKPDYIEFLFEATTVNCIELATDRHGCCVLQKCLSHSDGEQRRRLVCEVTSNALILSQDPFGNYVVQFIFELRLPWATLDILDQLEGNYGDLSVQKYSSNVVEKCLKYAGEERRARIIRELITNARLDQIMQDPYGNYVIQAALHQSKGTLHAALLEAVRPHVPVLRTSPYGKKVLSGYNFKK
ncbi:hypothetical protein Tsubulata_045691 [Turnera subulata]|uniref:PUM-HD domain-containing protein n=1 Tax=Turnera subulata TaxID=218843 RepID=A0A9Q0F8Y7_9ROSI|nr:hypothetical protein Tsubulata_045691 [Turnera subulata]